MQRHLRSFGPLAFILLSLVGCVAPAADDPEEIAFAEAPLVAAAGSLDLGDGSLLTVVDLRAASSTTLLTTLPASTSGDLVATVVLGAGVDRLFAQSGANWTLTLGASVYSLTSTKVTSVSLPSVKATSTGDKTNAFITVQFKPTELKYLKASGDVAKVSVGPAPASFSLTLGSATASSTTLLESAVIDASGGANLVLRVDLAGKAAWQAWPTGELRDGTLRLVVGTQSLPIALGRVQKLSVTQDSLSSYTVHCYAEHATFKPVKTDA